LLPRQNRATSVGLVHAMIAAPMLHRRIADNSAIRRAHECRGSNSLHLGFDNTPPKLAPYNAARTSVERRIHRVRTMLRPVWPAAGGSTVDRQARVLGLPAIARDEAQMDAVRVPAPDHPAAQRDDWAGGSHRNSSQAPRESVRSISALAGREFPPP
jgi:hypothetical protein